jgi:hypothetical protein
VTDLPESLEALWELADELGHDSVCDPLHVLEPVGLLLVRPLERWDSDCTPLNCLTFAQTGEDGTHFSLLQLEAVDLASGPVVMTVPGASEECNLVVATDFNEFLAIGAIGGWFTLEQLADSLDDALEGLATPDLDPWSEREQLLSVVRERMEIEPAPLTLKRFEELQLRYASLVVVDRSAGCD